MEKLISAVFRHDLAKVKSLLLDYANIEIKDKGGRTPLINSVIENDIDITTVLINNGANINIQDKLGCSPLHFASQNQNYEITKLLIENSANIDIADANGNTPLSNAVFYSRGRGEVIQLLLKAGADKEKKNNHGISPLDLAKTIANYNVKQYFDEIDE